MRKSAKVFEVVHTKMKGECASCGLCEDTSVIVGPSAKQVVETLKEKMYQEKVVGGKVIAVREHIYLDPILHAPSLVYPDIRE